MAGVGDIQPLTASKSSPPGWVIAELAGRQHGVVAVWQLVARGLTQHHVQYRIRDGQLRRLYRGVYALGHAPLSRHGAWMAAVLACGDGALLSNRHGAALRVLWPCNKRIIDVTAPRSRRGHRGIALHRPRDIHPDDRTVVDGIPVTSVARTVLDCAATASQREVDRLVEQAELRGVFDLRAFDALLDRSSGRRGVAKVERAIAGARPFVPFTRSQLERALLDVCHDADLPDPAMNVWVAGHEVDALFAGSRVVVEIDGAAVHWTRQARVRDPQRDVDLQLAGYHPLRVSEEWLRSDPAGVARAIRAMIAAWAA